MIKLSNIAITHISLVKSGANGKSIIYKSNNIKVPKYENIINIKKTDKEQGVIYGIVYSPDEEDSQGDFADSEEIKKAAYAFMKAKNINNVDMNHTFENVDAFVAESWIVKANDSIFPNEKEGSWAVAIQLESDELKALAKSGEIAGLSMAGDAEKTEVQKAEDSASKFKKLWEALGESITGFSIDVWTSIQKGKEVDTEKYKDELKAKIKDSTGALEKSFNEVAEKADSAEHAVVKQQKEVEELKKSNSDKDKKIESLVKSVELLEKSSVEIHEALKKSTQLNGLKNKKIEKDDTKGIV